MTASDFPRLRYDKVALRLVRDVRAAVEAAVPDGLGVVFTTTAPIREPARTTASLVALIRARLSPQAGSGEHAETLHGNQVRIRVVASRSPHAAKVAGFVHNPDPPPDALLEAAQRLLEAAGPPASMPDPNTLRRIAEQVLDTAG